MKQFKIVYMMIAAAVMAGCSVDKEAENTAGRTPINLSYTVAQVEATRAATNLNNSHFISGDKVMVKVSKVGEDNYTDYTYLAVGTDGKLTPVTTPIPCYPEDNSSVKFAAYYPASAGTSFTVKVDQTADADYKASDLMVATLASQAPTTSAVTLTFEHQMAKIIVNTTPTDGIVVSAITIKNIAPTVAFDQLAAIDYSLVTATGGPTDIAMSNNGAAVLPPQTVDGTFLEVTTNMGTAYYAVNNKTLVAGHAYTINLAVNTAAISATTTITEWNEEAAVNKSMSAVDSEPIEAVDLGLSVKWANMNVGAEHVTDYGLYFAWGDIVGRSGDNTEGAATDEYSFDWTTYKWSAGDKDGTQFSKYVPLNKIANWGGAGDPDDKRYLDLADDAAHANWGGNWRMPTYDELNELLATKSNTTNYTWTWCDGSTTKYNNTTVVGWQVTYKATNATIFLPVAGYRHDMVVENQGLYGGYWSLLRHADNVNNAYASLFTSGSVGMTVFQPSNGLSVRPVYVPNAQSPKKNPLWWVARYNMAEDRASFVAEHSTTSQYVFSWADALRENVSGYHLPTFDEQVSIFPCDKESTFTASGGSTSIFDLSGTMISPDEFSEVACSVGGSSISARTSVIGRPGPGERYAVRFIGTPYASAWHYKWVTSPCAGLLIESYLIPGGCADLDAAKTVLADLASSSLFTGAANDIGANQWPEYTTITTNAFCQRFLPACGYRESGNGTITGYSTLYGLYWSATATASDSSFGWFWCFTESHVHMANQENYSYSVRLFRDH